MPGSEGCGYSSGAGAEPGESRWSRVEDNDVAEGSEAQRTAETVGGRRSLAFVGHESANDSSVHCLFTSPAHVQ